MRHSEVEIASCPLCGSVRATEDSIAEPNLYSEKLAQILECDEGRLLQGHSNWRCTRCDLIYKKRWFSEATVRRLFTGAVAKHPKGWDAALGRFDPRVFRATADAWAASVAGAEEANVRRGRRELISIVESITKPRGFEPATVIAAIAGDDVAAVFECVEAVVASITEPAPFRRFAGFRSTELWDYLQLRTGGFDGYAEIGCPLWGLLTLAGGAGLPSTLLQREEPNYWGTGCVDSGQQCTARLLLDTGVTAASWIDSRRYPLIGLFQYLDHVVEPLGFLQEVFARADSAAIILDTNEAPVAIQHVTGWTEAAMRYVAEHFGKRLHSDFAAIRPSGNVLYVLVGGD